MQSAAAPVVAHDSRIEHWMPSDILFDDRIYPRERIKTELVQAYIRAMEAGAKFPPVVLSPNGELLDGAHRWMAYRAVQDKVGSEALIPVTIEDIRDPREQLRFAIEVNSRHGERITLDDIQHIARSYPEIGRTWINLARFGFVWSVEEQNQIEAELAEIEARTSAKGNGTTVLAAELSTTGEKAVCAVPKSRMSEHADSKSPQRQTTPEAGFEETADEVFGDEGMVASGEEPASANEKTVNREPSNDLAPVFAKLAVQGLLSAPNERTLRCLSEDEQRMLATNAISGVELSALTSMSGDDSRKIRDQIKHLRAAGLRGEELVREIGAMDIFSAKKPQPEDDPWFSFKMRILKMREEVFLRSDVTDEQKTDIQDWATSIFTEGIIKLGDKDRIKPHSFAEYPRMKHTRTVEIENNIM
jgi:hypothetical protein